MKRRLFQKMPLVGFLSQFFSRTNAQEMAFYDPGASGYEVNAPAKVVQINLHPENKTLVIPSNFYGININPGTAKFEFANKPLLKLLKPDSVRIMTNIRVDWEGNGRQNIFPLSKSKGEFDWSELDALIDDVEEIGAEPYLALGFGPPQWLSGAKTPKERLPPKENDLNDYVEYMATIMQRYTAKKGGGIRRVTVENEPENVGYSIDLYSELFRRAYPALKKVAPSVEVGGPAIGYANWLQPSGRKMGFSSVLQYLKSQSLSFDFIDWHIYASSTDVVLKTLKAVRDIYPSNMPLVISELNRDWRYDGPAKARSKSSNTSWQSVSWLAYLIDNLQLAGVSQVFYFAWREDALGLIDVKSGAVRPNYYLLSAMTNFLGRQRIASETSHPSVGCIATLRDSKLATILYNRSAADVEVEVYGLGAGRARFYNQASTQSSDRRGGSFPQAVKIDPIAGKKGVLGVRVPAGGFVVAVQV